MTSTCTIAAELNGVTASGEAGSDYMILGESIEGLGNPEVKTNDLDRADDDGSVAGADYTQPRVLRIPMVIDRTEDPAAAMAALRVLKTAWQRRSTDQVLSITLPGYGPADDVVRFYGRPRGNLDVRLGRLYAGVVYAMATFVALDPVGYGPEETTAGSGTFTVTNDGDATSRRAVVELVGNGGTPVLTNASDGGADVRFGLPLAGGTSWFVDLADRTVVDGAGDDVFPGNVLAASLWPRLVPGANSLTVTGAASAEVVHRSGWW